MSYVDPRISSSDLGRTEGSDWRATYDARRRAFRRLHEGGCFVIPNPWDVGSARYLLHLGFPAMATTSAGFAFSQGRPDSTSRSPSTAAWTGFVRAAQTLKSEGRFAGFADLMPYADINGFLAADLRARRAGGI